MNLLHNMIKYGAQDDFYRRRIKHFNKEELLEEKSNLINARKTILIEHGSSEQLNDIRHKLKMLDLELKTRS